MGGNLSQNLKPEELSEFRKLNTTTTEPLDIPERPENRVLTDKKFLLAFGIVILLLLPFLIYCAAVSDLRRLTNGIDQCGNLCGYKNEKVEGIECSGQDFENQPYLIYQTRPSGVATDILIPRQCAPSCPYTTSGHDCYPSSGSASYSFTTSRYTRHILSYSDDNDSDVNINPDEFTSNWWKLIVVILLTLVLCVILMILLRYSTAVVVWTCIGLTVAICLAVTALFWYLHFNRAPNQENTLVPAIVATIFSVVVLAILGALFKRVKLVILLLKETTKAIFAMPLIILVPISVFLCEIILTILFVFTTCLIFTTGKLEPIEGFRGFYQYNVGFIGNFTFIYNAIVALWISQFIIGCHYVIVGGAIAKWYFAKNKRFLGSPIYVSLSNLFRFHLGSVAFGSLIVTIVEIIRALLRSLAEKGNTKWIVDCCMGCIGNIIKFFTKNAYIVTAIHGQSFYRSGKRAAKLLLSNIVNLATVSSITDWVLAISQILLIIICTAIAHFLYAGELFATVISFVVVSIVVIMSFAVFSVTNDTLFICFCEDSSVNDGISRPYCMTKGLMEFIETSKQVVGERKNSF